MRYHDDIIAIPIFKSFQINNLKNISHCIIKLNSEQLFYTTVCEQIVNTERQIKFGHHYLILLKPLCSNSFRRFTYFLQ